MVVETKKIVKYCEDYLKVKDFKDSCVNGLQVEGASKVSKIITGVSLSKKLIESAIKKRAKMIIVHHGIFDKHIPAPPAIKGFFKERLKLLLANNINLCGFHLPLDAHPVIGNNISLLKALQLKKVDIIVSPMYGEIGFIGEYQNPMKLNDFVDLINKTVNSNSYRIDAGPRRIKRVGIIVGSVGDEYEIAKKLGAQVFVTGEIKESVVRAAEEVKINIVAAGHYNSEKSGIINLGNLIAKKFGVKVEFVDIPCDI